MAVEILSLGQGVSDDVEGHARQRGFVDVDKMGFLSVIVALPAGMPALDWDKQTVCVNSVWVFVLRFVGFSVGP